MLPDPPKLACPFGPCFNLHRILCFIGHLWKRLLRTLIRHRDRKDQETQCTMEALLYSTNHCYFHMTVTKFMKIYEGDRFNEKNIQGGIS